MDGKLTTLQQTIKSTIQRYQMTWRGGRILIALSGGPDSMVLLDSLHSLQDSMEFECCLCHVNHGLRGEESDADERFVTSIAQRYNLPLSIQHLDKNEIAQIQKGNVEEVARELRYQKLVLAAKKLSCTQIATGHTLSDQAETVLFRLLRGTGISGLAAIQPVRTDLKIPIIRPLLSIRREEVHQYIKEVQLPYRMDTMNLDLDYTRVKIRNNLIPLLKDQYNPQIEKNLAGLASLVYEEERFWKSHVDLLLHKLGQATPKFPAGRLFFASLSRAEQKRIIRAYFYRYGIEPTSTHIEDVLSLLLSEKPQAELHLSHDTRLVRRYDAFYFTETKSNSNKQIPEVPLKIPGENPIPELNIKIKVELLSIQHLSSCMENDNPCFDADKLQLPLIVRSRKAGDRIQPLGMSGKKKVKKIFQENQITFEERDRIPIICSGDDIICVARCCVSEKYKIDENTTNILQLTIHRIH